METTPISNVRGTMKDVLRVAEERLAQAVATRADARRNYLLATAKARPTLSLVQEKERDGQAISALLQHQVKTMQDDLLLLKARLEEAIELAHIEETLHDEVLITSCRKSDKEREVSGSPEMVAAATIVDPFDVSMATPDQQQADANTETNMVQPVASKNALNPEGIEDLLYLKQRYGVTDGMMRTALPAVKEKFNTNGEKSIQDYLERHETALLMATIHSARWTRSLLGCFDSEETLKMIKTLIKNDASYEDIKKKLITRYESDLSRSHAVWRFNTIQQELGETIIAYGDRFCSIARRANKNVDELENIQHFARTALQQYQDRFQSLLFIGEDMNLTTQDSWTLERFVRAGRLLDDMKISEELRSVKPSVKSKAPICWATLANGKKCGGAHVIRNHRAEVDGALMQRTRQFQPQEDFMAIRAVTKMSREERIKFLNTDEGKNAMLGQECHHCHGQNHHAIVCPWRALVKEKAMEEAKSNQATIRMVNFHGWDEENVAQQMHEECMPQHVEDEAEDEDLNNMFKGIDV